VTPAARASLLGMVIQISHQEAVNKQKVRPAVVLEHDRESDRAIVAFGTTSPAFDRTLEVFLIEGGRRTRLDQDTLFFLSNVQPIEAVTERVLAKISRLPLVLFQDLQKFAEPRILEIAAAREADGAALDRARRGGGGE
jgi:hypothetical protein